MLRHLRVTNFAILSDVAIELTEGFNVLTGETGAGKSLIVEAVNLLRGGRASADIPRAGAKEAVVEAVFELPEALIEPLNALCEDAGLPAEDGTMLVRRVIQKGGRSRTYVNGALTTAKRLSQLGALLVDLSGQHQHQGLVHQVNHRRILDAFAAKDMRPAMRTAFRALADITAAIDELGGDEHARADRLDYIDFQLSELKAAELEQGEDDTLAAESKRLSAIDKLHAAALGAEQAVYSGDAAAVDTLGAAARELERVCDVDEALAEPLRLVEEARALAEEAGGALRDYAETLDGDPQRLAQVEERLALLSRIKRKHGGSLDHVLARRDELEKERDDLERRDERLAQLETARASAEATAMEVAAQLTEARRRAAKRLCKTVNAALTELAMGSATLSVKLEPQDLGPDGVDRVEFLLASNKGEHAKPLIKVASGGELSRIMLALKLALRSADDVAAYVFDEVDTGIGGVTAQVVGKQIRAIADERQVLCVTHLPQIAAYADTHFHVSKSEVDGRTETEVVRLNDASRAEEMARMLGGATVSKSARAHAKEMLRAAGS